MEIRLATGRHRVGVEEGEQDPWVGEKAGLRSWRTLHARLQRR